MTLREEVERKMREAITEAAALQPTVLALDCAVSVCVEMVERERQNTVFNFEGWVKAECRREAQRKEDAEIATVMCEHQQHGGGGHSLVKACVVAAAILRGGKS